MSFSTSCPTSWALDTSLSVTSFPTPWTGLAQPLFSPAFAALVCGFGTQSYRCIYIHILPGCSSFLRAAVVSSASLSLPGVLMLRTVGSQSRPREGGRDGDKLTVLSSSQPGIGEVGGSWLCAPPMPIHLCGNHFFGIFSFLDCELLKSRARALCLGLVNVWHIKASIKV